MTLNHIRITEKALKGELYYFLIFDLKPIGGEFKRCVAEFKKGLPRNRIIFQLNELIKAIRES